MWHSNIIGGLWEKKAIFSSCSQQLKPPASKRKAFNFTKQIFFPDPFSVAITLIVLNMVLYIDYRYLRCIHCLHVQLSRFNQVHFHHVSSLKPAHLDGRRFRSRSFWTFHIGDMSNTIGLLMFGVSKLETMTRVTRPVSQSDSERWLWQCYMHTV